MEDKSIVERESGLHKALSKGQIVMISLGGAIGTTLFLSSGIALGYAGPSVLVSYAIAGLIAVAMVFSLSEMAVMHPAAGSLGTYAETYLNPWAGFVVRYTYWFAQMIATGFEAVAAGIYMTYWIPEAPVWMWAIGFAAIVIYVNSRSVASFGTVEYWFAFIKVTAIVLFIILGTAQIFGLGATPVGLHNLYRLPGGFFPHGLTGMWMAVIIATLSFVGIEVIAVTSGETPSPEKAIPAALRTTAIRLFLFYFLALAVVAAIIPWTHTGGSVAVSESPFVKVLDLTGIPYAAGVMNFVIISAALSGMNTNVYLCSRMLFSLSRGRYAPRFLGRLSRAGAPVWATLVSGGCILAAVMAAKFTPSAYSYLQGVALFGIIVVWFLILVSHLRFRWVHRASELPVRMPLFPAMQILALALLIGLSVTMALDKDWNQSWIVGVPWLILVTIAYFIWKLAAHAPAKPH
ncbi:MAG TPA: amino acid permease [Rhizomicrobium sp.]|nr:amino acid permease [Rhizomicrobium sp.]